MRKLSLLTVSIAAAMVLAFGGGSAAATGHNQKSCEDSGGVWTTPAPGQKLCTFTETETGKNDNFQCTTTDETGGHGNLGNRTDGPFTDEAEENTGSGKCPPGQYPD